MENVDHYLNKGAELGVAYAPKLLLAIITLSSWTMDYKGYS